MKRRISNGAAAAAVLCLAVGSFEIVRATTSANGFGEIRSALAKGIAGTGRVVAATGPALAQGGAAPAQGAAPADVVFSNGKIVTVDERFTIAQAVAVKSDRIVAVGTSQEISKLAGPNTRTIDLRGRTVIPGLIDNHLHLLRAGNTWELELRWDGVDSRKRAIEMIRARAKSVGPGGWVFNIGGWATAQFTDDRKPFTREELDAIAPDNPMALQESYYQVFLNSRALK